MRSRKVTYTTKAHLVGPQGDLTGETIVLTLGTNGQDIERLEATGDVTLTEVDRITTGDQLTYVAAKAGIQRRRARASSCGCSSATHDGELPPQRRQSFDVLQRRLIRFIIEGGDETRTQTGSRHVLPPTSRNAEWRRSARKTSRNRTAAARLCAASASRCSRAKSSGCSGPNGAGKTTTFYMTVGLTSPDSGRVIFNGEDVTDLPMYARARKGIGYLPQEPSIFRGLTVEQNIMAILETLDLDPAGRRARCRELLAELNLTSLGVFAGLHAVGRRAPARRNHARARHLAEVSAARRAVCGHRSHRDHRYSEDHFSLERSRHRCADHRP